MARDYPWARRFAELALRALRRVHYEYGALHIGQQWRKEAPDLSDINHGAGVAAADELTVCAAIAQECLLSQGFSGAWIESMPDSPSVEEGPRHWAIEREKKYADTTERADFVIRRESPPNLLTPLPKDNSRDCYIEAKRVRRWTTRSHTDPHFTPSSPLIAEIMSDIEKLTREQQARPGQMFGHLLLWDLLDFTLPNLDQSSSPKSLLADERLSSLTLHQLRWMPVAWTKGDAESPPKVMKWLWIGLFEIPSDV